MTRRRVLAALAGTTATAGVASLLTNSAPHTTSPEIIGHRGADGIAPPNTMKAINMALSLPIAGVELDVRQTKDGGLVLFHDPILNWSSTGHGLVKDQTLEDLSDVRINGEPLITLDAALERLDDTSADIYLELKETGYTEQVMAAVREYNLTSQTTLVSLDQEQLKSVQGTEFGLGLVGSVPNPKLIDDAQDLEADIVMSHYVPRAIPWFIEEAKSRGLKAGIWSLIDTKHSVKDAIDANPDVITTNRPDLVLKLLRQTGSR